jgi:hypothetical protein
MPSIISDKIPVTLTASFYTVPRLELSDNLSGLGHLDAMTDGGTVKDDRPYLPVLVNEGCIR